MRAGHAGTADALPLGVLRTTPQPLLHLLFETSATGDPLPWINFFLDGVAHQSRDAEERTVTLVDLQREIREELLAAKVTNTTLRLAESLLDRPYVTAKRVTCQKRNRVYLSPRIMDAVYGATDQATSADLG